MKQIEIICNDKIYTEMLALELEAHGYRVTDKNTGRADLLLFEKEGRGEENVITFSRKEGSDLLRPFDIEELIRLIEEKSGNKDTEKRELSVSKTSPCAVYQGDEIPLSELEHKMLLYLYENRGRVVSAEELAQKVFGDPNAQNPTRVYISYLRNKLDERYGVKMIYTARGKGYMLKTASQLN